MAIIDTVSTVRACAGGGVSHIREGFSGVPTVEVITGKGGTVSFRRAAVAASYKLVTASAIPAVGVFRRIPLSHVVCRVELVSIDYAY